MLVTRQLAFLRSSKERGKNVCVCVCVCACVTHRESEKMKRESRENAGSFTT